MAHQKIKTYLWTRSNLPDLMATIYRDTDTDRYVVVYREGQAKIGDSFPPTLAIAKETANTELAYMGKRFATRRIITKNMPPLHAVGIDNEPMDCPRSRQKNAVETRKTAATWETLASEVLFAEGAYGRKPTIEDWQDGKDFFALNPPIWKGGLYFSIGESDFIYGLGYRKIMFGGHEGFDVDLVMEPPRGP